MKPMLACSINESDLDKLNYPLILQPKFDGIRCLVTGGKVLSRTGKPIPNNFVRNRLEDLIPLTGFYDGELVIESKTFNEIQSAIMREEGEPNFHYVIFDGSYTNAHTYAKRWFNLESIIVKSPYVERVQNELVYNPTEVIQHEERLLEQGFEGIILRSLDGVYKNGRSTLKEQYLLKLKRFKDAEAVVVGYEPMMHNNNEDKTNELGYMKRSTFKENMVQLDILGAFICEGINGKFKGKNFKVGSMKGITQKQRKEMWINREKLIGKVLTYAYLDCGVKDLPRNLSFKGWRND